MDAVKGMIPGMGGDEESPEEKEKARQLAIRQAEAERRKFYKTQEDAREVERQVIRDKYNIEKRRNDSDISEDEDEDFGGGAKKEEDDDPAAQAKKLADEQMAKAKELAAGKCSVQ